MEQLLTTLRSEEILYLFAIVAIGAFIGSIEIRGFKLGAAGVLFSGLVFGHYGMIVSKEIRDIGLLLFVFAVGIQAGPRFFRLFRRNAWEFAFICFAVVTVAALTTIALARALNIAPDLATGLYTGATTCTPALAAAIDVFNAGHAEGTGGTISVGYGVAYPFSMFGTILLIQLLPKLLRKDLKQQEEQWLSERSQLIPKLRAAQFDVTNPAIEGKTFEEVNVNRMITANVSRVRRGDDTMPFTPSTRIQVGDVITAVGTDEELNKLEMFVGPQRHRHVDLTPSVASQDVILTTGEIEGKSLKALNLWHNHSVILTRVRRQGVEFTPHANFVLEIGDTVRAVGTQEDVKAFAKWAGAEEKRLEETNLVVMAFGLTVGVLLGSIEIPAFGGNIKLGAAGGVFLIALLMGHFGRIGPLKPHVPSAANTFAREFGLLLFLAGAGSSAGSKFVQVISETGFTLLGAGMAVTVSAWITALLLYHFWRRFNILATMGSTSACMTNPPALNAAVRHSETDLTALAYAATYPLALIGKIVWAQILLVMMSRGS